MRLTLFYSEIIFSSFFEFLEEEERLYGDHCLFVGLGNVVWYLDKIILSGSQTYRGDAGHGAPHEADASIT